MKGNDLSGSQREKSDAPSMELSDRKGRLRNKSKEIPCTELTVQSPQLKMNKVMMKSTRKFLYLN